MFRLLIKHELKDYRDGLKAIWGGSLLFFVLALLSFFINNPIMTGISTFVALLSIAAMVSGPTFLIAYRDYQSMSGKEAYYTHTLPVESRIIYCAKLLFAWLVQLFSIALCFLEIYLLLLQRAALQTNGLPLKAAYTSAGLLLRETLWSQLTPFAIVLVSAFILLFSAGLIVRIFFSVALGSEAPRHHLGVGGPLIVYFSLYFFEQVIALLAMLFIPIGVQLQGSGPQFRLVFQSSVQNLSIFTNNKPADAVIGIGMIFTYAIATLVLILVSLHSYQKHTSVR